jgi:hypothetical protein
MVRCIHFRAFSVWTAHTYSGDDYILMYLMHNFSECLSKIIMYGVYNYETELYAVYFIPQQSLHLYRYNISRVSYSEVTTIHVGTRLEMCLKVVYKIVGAVKATCTDQHNRSTLFPHTTGDSRAAFVSETRC